MTFVQKMIRETVQRDGKMLINVGRGSPCTMGTVRALQRAGYVAEVVGPSKGMTVYRITSTFV